MNSRSIPADLWAHAREVLVFLFSRRHGLRDAEDLAQETLLAVLSREDYEFEKEEDFLRVVLGFARHISQVSYRAAARAAGSSSLAFDIPASTGSTGSASHTESRILLREIQRIAETSLSDKEWTAILQAATSDRADGPGACSGRFRVFLHRARKKLAKFAGWRQFRKIDKRK
jgi:DNA-directed RNA polymerase specialized sigma24 family protein